MLLLVVLVVAVISVVPVVGSPVLPLPVRRVRGRGHGQSRRGRRCREAAVLGRCQLALLKIETGFSDILFGDYLLKIEVAFQDEVEYLTSMQFWH